MFRYAVLLLLVLSSSCSRKPADRDAPEAASPAAPQASTATPVASAVPAPPPNVDHAQIDAIVTAWLDSQNQGRFDAYSALYAEDFEGVKRTGAHAFRFKRAGWLSDRAAMFKRPVRVDIHDLKTVTSGNLAIVTFVQKWASGAYADEGPKQLILKEKGGRLLIGQEEMLASRSSSARPGSLAPPPLTDFVFVKPTNDGYALLLKRGVELQFVTGHPSHVVGTDISATRPLLEKGVPTEFHALKGRAFAIHGEAKQLCVGTVTGFIVYADVVNHGPYGPDDVPPTSAQKALTAWELSDAYAGGRYIAAVVKTPAGCEGGLWARAQELSLPVHFEKREATSEEKLRLQAEVRKLPGFQSVQTDYEKAKAAGDVARDEAGKLWTDYYGDDEFLIFTDPRSGATYASASMRTGVCGAWGGEYWAFFRLSDDRLTLLSDPLQPLRGSEMFPFTPRMYSPDSAFDLDGDGLPELQSAHRLLQTRGSAYAAIAEALPPFLECGC